MTVYLPLSGIDHFLNMCVSRFVTDIDSDGILILGSRKGQSHDKTSIKSIVQVYKVWPAISLII